MSSILWLFIIHQKVAPVIINRSGPFLLLEEAVTFLVVFEGDIELELELVHKGSATVLNERGVQVVVPAVSAPQTPAKRKIRPGAP